MKKNNQLKIALILLLSFTIGRAQEISIYANGGLQGLNHKLKGGTNEIGFGGKLGIGYTHYLNEHFAVVTGIEGSIYQNKLKFEELDYRSDQVDNDGDAFEFRARFKNYQEKTKLTTINIPVMLQYRTFNATNQQFYFNAGGRIIFPMVGKTDATVEEFRITGYHADTNAELEDLPNHGFNSYYNWQGKIDDKYNIGLALSVETGFIFELSNNFRLYTGIYADYGLTNMITSRENRDGRFLITYDPDGSDNLPNTIMRTSKLVDKSNILSVGFQVRLGFGLGGSESCQCRE